MTQTLSAQQSNPDIFEPIQKMCSILHKTGRHNFIPENGFENCLCALIISFYPNCKTYKVLEALPYNITRMDLLDLLNTMARLGFYSRRIHLNQDAIDPRLFPVLVVAKDGTPFVLSARNGDGTDNILKTCGKDAEIYIFKPYDEHKARTSKFIRTGTGHGWFRALTERFNGSFVQIAVAGFFLNLIALTTPLFIMLVYDRVIAADAPDILPMLGVGMALAILFEWKLRSIRSHGLSWMAGRIDNLIGNKIFEHLLKLPPELIERASVSSQVARIRTFEAIRDFFSGSVFLSLLELPFVFIAATAIYIIAGPLVFVPLSFAVLYILLFSAVRHKVKTVIRLAAKATSQRQSFTIESLETLEAVRCMGLTDRWLNRYRLLSGQERELHFRLNWVGLFSETFAHGLTLLAAVSTVGFGAHLVWAGGLSTGGLVASMILVWRVLKPFYSLCTMIPRLEQIRNSILQVDKLIDIDTEDHQAERTARLPRVRGRVCFENVMMNYADKSDMVISRLDFVLDAGGFMVLTGENGSGKTTVLKLVQGLFKPDEGAVQIDGFDIRQLDARDLRRQIAYVAQEAEFMDASILENMYAVNPTANMSDIESALKQADAYDDVMKLEDGLNTSLGLSSHENVSASLKVQLSLARGYLHPSALLLIDELPNSLVNGKAGENLKAYIESNKEQKTIIFVTYRRDFMILADQVVLMQRGKPPQIGQYNTINKILINREAA